MYSHGLVGYALALSLGTATIPCVIYMSMPIYISLRAGASNQHAEWSIILKNTPIHVECVQFIYKSVMPMPTYCTVPSKNLWWQ
jgi:hypothetical protein